MRNLFVIMTIALFWYAALEDVNAESDSFGKSYFKSGYKESFKALTETEDHFKRKIALPTQLPPIPFTHSMGRFSDLGGLENDKLEIFFINKDLPKIIIRFGFNLSNTDWNLEKNKSIKILNWKMGISRFTPPRYS